LQVVELLLENGADLHQSDVNHETPLSLARNNHHKEVRRAISWFATKPAVSEI
jgi:ankyrin repeat protein